MSKQKNSTPQNNSRNAAHTPREDKRRQWRVFEIAHFIRDNNYPNVPKIRAQFELSRSTVMRDLAFLQDEYKMPIEYSEEHHGYYFSDPTFEIQSVMMSEGELLSVSTILPLMEQYKNTPLEATFKSLMNKLIQMMPDKISVSTAFVDQDIKFISDPLPRIDASIFNSAFSAVRAAKTVEFKYRSLSSKDYTQRALDPYKILCQKGNWYLIGLCHTHNEIRVYALSRMVDLTVTNKTFQPAPNFNIEKYIDPDFGIWLNKGEPQKIELQFSSDINTLILERTWHANQECRQNPDGTVYLSFMSNQLQETQHWIQSFGSHVKVLNPPELISAVKDEISRMQKLY